MALAYLGNQSNTILGVDAVTGAAITSYTGLGTATRYVSVSPDGHTVAYTMSNRVGFITVATGTRVDPVFGTLSVDGDHCWHPDSSRIWSYGNQEVTSTTPAGVVADHITGLTGVAVPGRGGLAISANGAKLYAGGLGGVYEIDIAAGAVARTFTFAGAAAGYQPVITGDGSTLFAADNDNALGGHGGHVWHVDLASGTVGTPISVNDFPLGLCFSPDGLSLWVACAGSTPGVGVYAPAVQRISTATLAVTATVTAGQTSPIYVAVEPSGATLWAANDNTKTAFPITISTLTVNTGTPTGGGGAAKIGLPYVGAGGIGAGTTVSGAVSLGPLAVTAGGTISGAGTGAGTISGTAVLNIGPVTVVARTTLEVVTATAALRLGPLVVVAVSGRVGPRQFPVPGFRGRWRLTLHNRAFAPATLNSTIIAELADARGRRLDQAWNTPATLTFTLDGRADTAALVAELLHDVVAWRWDDQTGLEQPVFRGPITQSEDQLTADSHTVTYTCHDYAALLTRRLLTSTYTVTGRDQDDVVADLLAAAVAARTSSGTALTPASYLPVSLFTAAPAGTLRGFSGQLRDRTYYGSQNVGQAVDDLAKVDGGFDYDVRPSAVDTTDSLRVFYPAQGITRTDVALQYGSTVASLTRTVDSSTYANYVRVLGNNQSANPTPQLFAEYWDPTAILTSGTPVGLWMTDDTAADVTVIHTLQEKAHGDINYDAILDPAYTLNMAPDAYTWGNPNMGDVVALIVNSGRLNVNSSVRVLGISYDISDDGAEDVVLTVTRPQTSLAKLFNNADRDVKALARR